MTADASLAAVRDRIVAEARSHTRDPAAQVRAILEAAGLHPCVSPDPASPPTLCGCAPGRCAAVPPGAPSQGEGG